MAEYDLNTNDFPRDENGMIDSSFDDLYIKCRQKRKIYYIGKGKDKNGKMIRIMEAYVPKKSQGKSILFRLQNTDKITILSERFTDEECTFRFNLSDLDAVCEAMQAQKNRINEDGEYNWISPFSKKNLPKTKYIIPENDMKIYKEVISNIPPDQSYILIKLTRDFIKKYIVTKKFTTQNVNVEQRRMMLSGKNYIHAKGLWSRYINYLKKNIQ